MDKAKKFADHDVDAERATAGLRVFALGIDSLARAAKEGYAVEEAALDLLAQAIVTMLPEYRCAVLRERTKPYIRTRWEERPSPNANAFTCLDKVIAAVASAQIPDGVTADASRILRIYENRGGEEALMHYTGVVVTLVAPGWDDRLILVSAEGT